MAHTDEDQCQPTGAPSIGARELSLTTFQNWISARFGEDVLGRAKAHPRVRQTPDALAGWQDALRDIVGVRSYDRALDSDLALRQVLSSEPIDVPEDQYVSLDDALENSPGGGADRSPAAAPIAQRTKD